MKISILPGAASAWLLSTQSLGPKPGFSSSSAPDGSDHKCTFKLEVKMSATELEKHADEGLRPETSYNRDGLVTDELIKEIISRFKD